MNNAEHATMMTSGDTAPAVSANSWPQSDMTPSNTRFLDEPPPSRQHKVSDKWVTIVNDAKANPGKWAAVGTYSPGVASQIRAGMYPAFVPAGLMETERRAHMKAYWEVTTRSVPNTRRCEVFIRWKG